MEVIESKIGLFYESEDAPLAWGQAYTQTIVEDASQSEPVDMVQFTCAACHTGRVELDDGSHKKKYWTKN